MDARTLADLPYAHLLGPHTGALEQEGDYGAALFDGLVFEDAVAANARFDQCAFSSVSLSGGGLRRSRFSDVWLRAVRIVGTDLAETQWRDAQVVSTAFAGVEAFSTQWRRVVFRGCKLDSVNFRQSTFTDVVFEDCVLRDVDWAGSALNAVRFPGSAVHRARFGKAELADTDFRGATELDVADGYASLRGAIIDTRQLVAIAPMLAAAVGITIKDG